MELIDRCGLLNKIPAVNPSKDEKVSRCGATRDMMMLVMSVPTIDPVHAAGGVYCLECACWLPSDVDGEILCALSAVATKPDDFCSSGEPKA